MVYNKNNIFYKIIHKEINTNLILDGDHFIVINDISPKAPIHVLVIPKGDYIDYYDFIVNATQEEIQDFNNGIKKVIEMMNLRESGFRLINNSGKFAMQEVMHMHVHILGKSA